LSLPGPGGAATWILLGCRSAGLALAMVQAGVEPAGTWILFRYRAAAGKMAHIVHRHAGPTRFGQLIQT